MARKKSENSSTDSLSPRILWTRRIVIAGAIAVGVAGLTSFSFIKLKSHVERKYATPGAPPTVVLKSQPVWMDKSTVEKILRAAQPMAVSSAFDQQQLIDVRDQLYSDPDVAPWIESINKIRQTYGKAPGDTIELDLTFRTPVALVRAPGTEQFWLVDSQGIKLPDMYEAAKVKDKVLNSEGRVVIRLIDGVAHRSSDPGCVWQGEDVIAGIKLLALISDKPYAQDIVKVDVSNFGGRRDPAAAQLVLITRFNTEVRWGLPAYTQNRFGEVDDARKLLYLEKISAQFGQIDARRPWIDVRFDRVNYPKPPVADAR